MSGNHGNHVLRLSKGLVLAKMRYANFGTNLNPSGFEPSEMMPSPTCADQEPSG